VSAMTVSLSRRKVVPVASYADAVRTVVMARGDVGATSWYRRGAGRIFVDGVQVAFVSYNGRCWEGVDTGEAGKKEIEVLP
jgi:hypothetical protein